MSSESSPATVPFSLAAGSLATTRPARSPTACQAGILPFAGVLFLMTDSALSRLEQSSGWEVGKDPRVVILPAGATGTPDGNTDTQSGTMDATSRTMAPHDSTA